MTSTSIPNSTSIKNSTTSASKTHKSNSTSTTNSSNYYSSPHPTTTNVHSPSQHSPTGPTSQKSGTLSIDSTTTESMTYSMRSIKSCKDCITLRLRKKCSSLKAGLTSSIRKFKWLSIDPIDSAARTTLNKPTPLAASQCQ